MNFSTLLWVPSGWEIAIIIVAILLLFGGRKIPELMRGIGQGMNEFKKARKSIKDEMSSTEESSNTSN